MKVNFHSILLALLGATLCTSTSLDSQVGPQGICALRQSFSAGDRFTGVADPAARLPASAGLMTVPSFAGPVSSQGQSNTAPSNQPLYSPHLPDFNTIEMTTSRLRDNVYAIEGGPGANVIALVGQDGVLLVDAQYPELTSKIVKAIRAITDKPIRFLIDTHVHPDHVGGNENFAKMGVVVLGTDQIRERLLHGLPDLAGYRLPAPPIAAPMITYTGRVTIHIDGEAVELVPVPHAHTDGDTLVHFPVANLIMMGDLYWNEEGHGYISRDGALGGSIKGIIDGLGVAIGIAGPDTKIIPAHGTPTGRKSLIAQRDTLIEIRNRVQRLVQEGKSVDQVLAAHITSDFDAQVPGGQRTASRLVRQIYEDLKSPD